MEIELILNFEKEVQHKTAFSTAKNFKNNFTVKILKDFFESPRMRDLSNSHNVAITTPYNSSTDKGYMDVLVTRPQDVLGIGHIISVDEKEVKFKFEIIDERFYNDFKNKDKILTLDGIVLSDEKILSARITYRLR